jgi:hypothetical protein
MMVAVDDVEIHCLSFRRWCLAGQHHWPTRTL